MPLLFVIFCPIFEVSSAAGMWSFAWLNDLMDGSQLEYAALALF
jgi:hypothetical protein